MSLQYYFSDYDFALINVVLQKMIVLLKRAH